MVRLKPDLAGCRFLLKSGLWSKLRLTKAPSPIAMVICLGAVLSVAGYSLVLSLHKANSLKAFEGPAQQYALAISKALDSHLEVVKSASAFVKASAEIDRWAFFQFTRDVLPRHSGIQAIEWVPRVPGEERAAYEERAQADGLFGFRFIALGGDSDDRIEATARSEHFPIYLVEPFNGNEADLGRDLATSESQLEALLRSRDTGRMVVAPLHAPAGPQEQAELVVFHPVYSTKSIPGTKPERIENLRGFSRGVLRLGQLAYAVRPQITGRGGLDVYTFMRDEAGRQLLHYLPQSSDASPKKAPGYADLAAGLHVERDLTIADQTWTVVIAPSRNWQDGTTRLDAWLVLGLGLLLTTLLLQHLLTSRNRTRVIEQAVTQRTAELRGANDALELEVQERKRAELEMRAAKEKAEDASRAKSDFLAMAGHELRTPLNAIIGFSEVMHSQTLGPLENENHREMVANILSSGHQLLSIINDILELTRLESDSFGADNGRLAIGELVREVCEVTRNDTDAAGLELKVKVAKDSPVLKASRQAVGRILANLLSNAIKFTPTGGRVTVDCATDPSGGAVIEVSDTGIGIAPETQKRIFQPFTQADQSLSRQHEGMGLGLTLTLRLVELHGGALELDSQIGEGTRVRVTLPAERGEKPRKTSKTRETSKTATARKTGKSSKTREIARSKTG